MKLFEHRKRVPFLHWALLAAVMTAMLILGPIAAEAQEFRPFTESEAHLLGGSVMCVSPGLSAESITLLNEYQKVVNAVEAYHRGGPWVPEEFLFFGEMVFETGLCATTLSSETIEIIRGTEGYVLARFSSGKLGTFIVNRMDLLYGLDL